MATPEFSYISWRARSEIDYFPLFVPLWFSLNSWMRDHFNTPRERQSLELLKQGGHQLSDEFAGLIQTNDARGSSFRGNLAELQYALVNASISYDVGKHKGKPVSLDSCVIDWNKGQLESLLRDVTEESVFTDDTDESNYLYGELQQDLELSSDLWVENDPNRLFAAYMEIVYQVRCALFHGGLAPIPENERVIRYLYLTLSAMMERI